MKVNEYPVEYMDSSKAFIHQDGRFLLQHDNDPNIYHPDHWGLFGGKIGAGETSEQCLLRELNEELNLCSKHPRYLYPWKNIHLYLVSLGLRHG